MRKLLAATLAACALLAGCGDDDTTATDGAATETTTADASDGSTETSTAEEGDDGGASSGAIFPGEDVDICAMFTPEELAPFVDFPLEEGDPFFSGSSTNSCDWDSPDDAAIDDIGAISIRLTDRAVYVQIDDSAYLIDGIGDEPAQASPRYGQTDVFVGDAVVTFQVVGMATPVPEIAAEYPDLVSENDALVSTESVHASVALALAFAERFGG